MAAGQVAETGQEVTGRDGEVGRDGGAAQGEDGDGGGEGQTAFAIGSVDRRKSLLLILLNVKDVLLLVYVV